MNWKKRKINPNNTINLLDAPSKPAKTIISVSRRSDIPAFFGKWFLKQIDQGYAEVKNPFSSQISKVSLLPENVAAFVFWSKNYQPFLPHLKHIEKKYNKHFLFHYTITGYSGTAKKILEPETPEISDTLSTIEILAKRYGRPKIIWRFDPIIFTNITDFEERLSAFSFLVKHIKTKKCMISFVDLYGKVKRRFDAIEEKHGITFHKPSFAELVDFAKILQAIAKENNIQLYTCCEDSIGEKAGITKGHCIDAIYLQELYSAMSFTKEIRPTRKECGCFLSKDIGKYNSCKHNCLYCYANK